MGTGGTPSYYCPAKGTFGTTHWSVVTAAANRNESQAQEALSTLCQTYWYPIYAYLRGHGHKPEDAQDLTQALFLRLLQTDFPSRLDPQKGRFRSYLLGALNHLLADSRDRQNAQRRGGTQPHISFDLAQAEGRFASETADNDSPDRIFDRHWALALLDRVLERLGAEQTEAGAGTTFAALRPFLIDGGNHQSYSAVATRFGQTEAAVSKAVSRLRQRYQHLFWEEISQTVTTHAEAEDELRYLCSVIGE